MGIISRRTLPTVVPQYAPQPTFTLYLLRCELRIARRCLIPINRPIAEGAMRAHRIVKRSVPLAQMVHVICAGDGEMVEALTLQRTDERLGVAIHLGRVRTDANQLDTLTIYNVDERSLELGVTVSDHVCGGKPMIAQEHGEVARLLGDPFPIGIEGGRRHPDALRSDVLHEEHKDIALPLRRMNLLGQEISRPEGIAVALDEVIPRALPRLGAGLEAIRAQQIPDRRAGDRPSEAELPQFAMDAGDAPLVLARQAQDDLGDAIGRTGPSWPSRLLGTSRGRTVPPTANRGRAGDRDEHLQPALAQWGRNARQAATFARRGAHVLAQLAAQDGVLGFQVVEAADQLIAVGGGSRMEQGSRGFIEALVVGAGNI
jgi:hypothetical protein